MEQLKLKRFKVELDNNYILLLTSNSIEKDALNKLIKNRRNIEIDIPHKGCSIGEINNKYVIHLTGTCGFSDKHSIARIAVSYLEREALPTPQALVLFGFCWGNPSKSKIGMTIISSHVNSINKMVQEPNGITYKNIPFTSELNVNDTLIARLNQNNNLNVCQGEIVSLETLITSTINRDALLSSLPNVIGGEMEAFALMPSLEKMNWLVVKTVSDFACDDFDRVNQDQAAEITAEKLPLIINEVLSSNNVNVKDAKDVSRCLYDELIGNTITIRNDSFTSDNLNDFLNDIVGPAVFYKLSQYCSGVEYDYNFPYLMVDYLLETAQNSFRHGKAEKVSITFNPTTIVILETGQAFDMRMIEGKNGGALAWKRVNDAYISNESITYSVKGKRQTLKLNKIDTFIKKIINECSASVIPNTIRSSIYRETLSSNESCNEIYVDVKEIFMSSRNLNIFEEIQTLLNEGKRVYVSCHNDNQAKLYKEYIKGNNNNLIIFSD